MKRLVVNAFRPGEHKVISSQAAKMDLPPRHNGVIFAATDRPTCPIRNTQWNEPALPHKCINLRAKWRRFRRPKVIADHDPVAIVQQVTVAIANGVQKNVRAIDRVRHSMRAESSAPGTLRPNSTALLSDAKCTK